MENQTQLKEIKKTKETIQQEKLFTQEQVNDIIKKRLERERKEKEIEEEQNPDELQAVSNEMVQSLEEREKELSRKELRLSCEQILFEYKLPNGLFDVLKPTNAEEFEKTLNELQSLGLGKKSMVAPLASQEYFSDSQPSNFGKAKHEPRFKHYK